MEEPKVNVLKKIELIYVQAKFMIKDNLKRSFINKGIFLKDSWLHSMIDSGLKSYELIFAHLIELDILETCEPCPLPDITREPKFIYQGENVNQSYTLPQIFLQINEVIDISLPLEKRRALERSERGTLKILMSDGTRNFVAISKKPIFSFSTDITPGSKIFIKIPIESRYGIIFLSDEKIEFLKGKSQSKIDHQKFIYSKKSNQTKSTQNIQSQEKQTNPMPRNNPQQIRESNQRFLSDSNDESDNFSNEEEESAASSNTKDNTNKRFIDLASSDFDSQFLDEYDGIEPVDDSDFDKLPSNDEKRKLKNSNNKTSDQIIKPNSNDDKTPTQNYKNSHNQYNNYISDSSESDVSIISENDSDKEKHQNDGRYLQTDDDYMDLDESQFYQNINHERKNSFFSVRELITKKNIPQEGCFETIMTYAEIVDCSDFFLHNDTKKYFTLNVILRDPTGEIKVKVDPEYILQIIKMDPYQFFNLNPEQMEEYFPKILDYFISLNPPFTLHDFGNSENIRYTLIQQKKFI